MLRIIRAFACTCKPAYQPPPHALTLAVTGLRRLRRHLGGKVLVNLGCCGACRAHNTNESGRSGPGPLAVADQPEAWHIARTCPVYGDFAIGHHAERLQMLECGPKPGAPQDRVIRAAGAVCPQCAFGRKRLKCSYGMKYATCAGLHDRGHHDDIAKSSWQVRRVTAFLDCLPPCSCAFKEHSSIHIVCQKGRRAQRGPGSGRCDLRDLGQDLRARVATTDHHDAQSLKCAGRYVMCGVNLETAKRGPTFEFRNKRIAPSPCGTHHHARMPRPVTCLYGEVVVSSFHRRHQHRPLHREVVAGFVLPQVANNLVAAGVLLLGAGHGPACNGAPICRREQAQRVPAMLPGTSACILSVQDQH